MAPRVLLTGGAGFIGSHTVIILLRAGYAITVVDNLVNSSLKSVERVREIAADEGIEGVDLDVEVVDMCDKAAFEKVRKINLKLALLKIVGVGAASVCSNPRFDRCRSSRSTVLEDSRPSSTLPASRPLGSPWPFLSCTTRTTSSTP